MEDEAMTALCYLVVAVLGFALGAVFNEWQSQPPEGYQLIEIPKTTHLIFSEDGLHIRKLKANKSRIYEPKEKAMTPPNDKLPPRQYQSESFQNLKAWVHWALKNPIDEDQKAHAKATNDLFALLGTRDHQLADAAARIAELEKKLEEAIGALEMSDCKCMDERFLPRENRYIEARICSRCAALASLRPREQGGELGNARVVREEDC